MKILIKNSVYLSIVLFLSLTTLNAVETSQDTQAIIPAEDILQQIDETTNQTDPQILDQTLEKQTEEALQDDVSLIDKAQDTQIPEEIKENSDYLESLNTDKKAAEKTSALDKITQQLATELKEAQEKETKQDQEMALTQPEIPNLDTIDQLEKEVLDQIELENEVQEALEKIEDIELK